jgi:hypothetical protein
MLHSFGQALRKEQNDRIHLRPHPKAALRLKIRNALLSRVSFPAALLQVRVRRKKGLTGQSKFGDLERTK